MTAKDLMFPASLHAAAKINLFLRITGKRTDGYHTLVSGVVFTEFGDRITINRAAADEICLSGPFAGDLMKDSGGNIWRTQHFVVARIDDTIGTITCTMYLLE